VAMVTWPENATSSFATEAGILVLGDFNWINRGGTRNNEVGIIQLSNRTGGDENFGPGPSRTLKPSTYVWIFQAVPASRNRRATELQVLERHLRLLSQ
jgi:hypothetical protein